MRQLHNFDREISKAAILGLLTLATNTIAHITIPDNIIPFGNVFVFAAAMALGVFPALVATATGIIPETLFTGDHLYGLRMLVLAMSIAYYARHKPRVPSYFVTVGLWIFIFAPLLSYVDSFSGAVGGSLNMNLYVGLIDVLLTMITGATLMNASVWGLLAEHPRHIPLTIILTHVITIVSTLCVFFTLLVAQIMVGSPLISSSASMGSIAWLGWLFTLSIIMPSLISDRLAKLVMREFKDNGLLSGANSHSFSGLSSDYWRRCSSGSIARMADELRDASAGSSEGSQGKPLLLPATNGILTLNKNRTITFANRAFHKLASVTTNEIIGKDLRSIAMDASIRGEIIRLAERAFDTGSATTEYKRTLSGGGLQFLEIVAYRPEGYESSAISGPDSVIVTLKDITERRTVRSNVLAAQKQGSLGVLVPGIAHEFNNALTSISGVASVVKNSGSIEELRSSMQNILDHCRRAGGVVNQLLNYAHGEPGQAEQIHLKRWFDERLPLLDNIVGETCKVKIYDKSAGKDLSVRCDPNLFMQALTNLIISARESYGRSGGEIKIELGVEEIDEAVAGMHSGTHAGNFVRIKVQDQGVGVSPEALEQAFNSTPDLTSRGSRTQGLAIVFAIVRAHDGFMNAESHPEKGTTISLYLPFRSAETALEEITAKSTNGSTVANTNGANGERQVVENEEFSPENLLGSNEHVLVVEDDPNVRDLVSTMLSTLGYKVTACEDGTEALTLLSQSAFDLMLVDMVMPKMQGFELIDRAKELSHIVPLVMTGYGQTRETEKRKLNVVQKPFDLDTLALAVKKALLNRSNKTSAEIARTTLH